MFIRKLIRGEQNISVNWRGVWKMNKKYKEIYGNYWPKASQKISDLIIKYAGIKDQICEVGAASGHIMAYLTLRGYQITGYEIRQKVCLDTNEKFETHGINTRIINDDIMNIDTKYDVLYTTGLLQCLDEKARIQMIEKFSKLSPVVIVVVPEIIKNRNDYSGIEVGVSGCCEYQTDSLGKELNCFFKNIIYGFWSAKELELADNFLWFVCH